LKSNFERCLGLLFGDEGGYANDPRDNGGPTNFGITQRVLDEWRDLQKLPRGSVREITRGEAAAIYLDRYWNKVKADELPPGIDYVTFDCAANSGPTQAVKWLQQALMVTIDGVIGPETLAAAAKADVPRVIRGMKTIRMAFLQSLDDWEHFGRGWTNRVEGVTRDALAMTLEVVPPAAPKPAPKPRPTPSGPLSTTGAPPVTPKAAWPWILAGLALVGIFVAIFH
jgi:lysozyme family protein